MSMKREFLKYFRSEVDIALNVAVHGIIKYGCQWNDNSGLNSIE